jgi:hypothetical protein
MLSPPKAASRLAWVAALFRSMAGWEATATA